MKKVPALKQVLILDTCRAGAAAAKLTQRGDIPSDQIRAMERLKDRVGFHVLMGCAASKVSYEASRYGQGLLTYALLQGIKGAALRDEQFIDVQKLFQYVSDEVPELAQNIGGVQRPLVAAPRGTSFDVGKLIAEDKAAVPLAKIRPLVIRPHFIEVDDYSDSLDLSALLKRRLIDDSAVETRDGASPLAFIDSDDFPGAVKPTGGYSIDAGKNVTVHVTLTQDGKKPHYP